MAARLTCLVIDANDPAGLARFWADVLGWDLHDVDPDDGSVVVSDPQHHAPILLFEPVPEAKAGKNRLHLDVNPLGCDQDEELERLQALGARAVDIGQGDVSWVVLADPEGNELCLLRKRHEPAA